MLMFFNLLAYSQKVFTGKNDGKVNSIVPVRAVKRNLRSRRDCV